MRPKSILNKTEPPQVKENLALEIERKLLPRLKFMGYVMYVWSGASLAFAFMIPEEKQSSAYENYTIPNFTGMTFEEDEEDLPEYKATEVLNFFLVAGIFAAVGTTCFWIEKKKRKTLFSPPRGNGENGKGSI